METCVVVSQHHRNHHHHHNYHHLGRSGRSGFSSAGGGLYFSSPPPSRAFRGINCRSALQSGAGILPPPLSAFPSSSTTTSYSSPPSSPSSSTSSSPRCRTITDLPSPRSEPPPPRRQQPSRRSSPIPITTKRTTSLPSQSTPVGAGVGASSLLAEDGSSHTELWAGPAYSNSPPPSSLPIPKFSLCGKRSASLDLPHQMERAELLRPLPKSAPASPSREGTGSSPANRFFSDAFATATSDLCRMLNLNLDDD